MKRLSIAITALGLSLPYARGAEQVQVYWDDHNVPYISATTDAGVLWGQGWALAECNYPILRRHHAVSMGYSTKYLGDNSFNVESDFLIKQLEIPEIAQQIYVNMPTNIKTLIDAFNKGLNDYYLANKPYLDQKYAPFKDLLALPVTGADTIAAELVLYMRLFAGGAIKLINGLAGPEDFFPTTHSNEWVVRSDRSVTGHPLLQVDPHVAVQYEESLFTFLCGMFSSNLQAVGFTQLGAPFIRVGAKLARANMSGDHGIAWTLTAGALDQGDVFKVQENAAATSYLFNGVFIPFTVKRKYVERPDGTKIVRSYKYTVHGLVLQEGGGFAYALKHVLTGTSDINQQFYAMLTASDINGFYTALDQRAWPGGNVVVASDAPAFADQIRYILYGPCPVRDPTKDWTQIIDGSTSSTLWSAFHLVSELPQVTGTSQDHFINDNAGVYHTWSGFTSQSLPAYMILDGNLTTFRQERAEALLASGQLDMNAMVQIASDQVDNIATYAIPLLSQAFTTYGSDPLIVDPSGLLDDLIAVLNGWGRVASATSQIATLFECWLASFSEQHGELFDRPNSVPAQFTQAEAIDALNDLVAVFDVLEILGLPNWGTVHYLQRGALVLPIGGTRESLRSAYHAAAPGQTYLQQEVTNGQTCPIVVELGTDAATTKMRYTKALDNCVDFNLPPFGTVESQDWANLAYHSLATTLAQAQQAAVRTEALTYVP